MALPLTDHVELDPEYGWAAAEKLHPGVFAERRLGFVNAPHHWEWYEHELMYDRLAVVAPRDSAKSEVFSVVSTAHFALFRPGSWQVVFSNTQDQAMNLLERIVVVAASMDPMLVEKAPRLTGRDVILGNWARIMVASVGKSFRGAHPDRIVGDDVLTDANTSTAFQRRKTAGWWFGTVAPMAHPGKTRLRQWGKLKPKGDNVYDLFPPTKIRLVGTPFHQADLLMGMKENPVYRFFRYAAEFEASDLIPGSMAIEAA